VSAPGTSLNVSVFPKVYLQKDRPKPHRVRWQVAGREKEMAFATKKEATTWQIKLQGLIDAAVPFDTETRLPVVLVVDAPGGPTCLTLAREVLAEDWAELEASSNRGIIEGLAACLPGLVPARQGDGGHTRQDLDRALLVSLCAVPPRELTAKETNALRWLERQSLPVRDVDEAALKRALQRARTHMDGVTPVAASTFRRKRNALSKVFTYAISTRALASSPLRAMRKPTKAAGSTVRVVDPMEVVAAKDAQALLACVANPVYRLLLAVVFYAGLRPSEADGLRVMDVVLRPAPGRSELHLRRSTTETLPRYSATGQTRKPGPLKHRKPGKIRIVPIPHVLADMLREAVAGKDPADLVVSTRNGTPISGTNRAGAYKAARAIWVANQGHAVSDLVMPVPYSLRHACATLWLKQMPIAEAAKRLGHTPAQLTATYANVIETDAEGYTAAVDDAFGM
jgi:integrase